MIFWTHISWVWSHVFFTLECSMKRKKHRPSNYWQFNAILPFPPLILLPFSLPLQDRCLHTDKSQNIPTPKMKPFCGEHKWQFFFSKIWQSKWLDFIVLSTLLEFFCSTIIFTSLHKTRIQRTASEKHKVECLISESKYRALFLILMKLMLEVQS